MTDSPYTAREYLEECLSYFEPQIRESEEGLSVTLPKWKKGGWFGREAQATACSMGAMALTATRLSHTHVASGRVRDNAMAHCNWLYIKDPEFRKAVYALVLAIGKYLDSHPVAAEFFHRGALPSPIWESVYSHLLEEGVNTKWIADDPVSVFGQVIEFNDNGANEKAIWTVFTQATKLVTE